MRTEIRHWTTTNYKGDFIPAFVEERDGSPDIVVNASDFIGMTKDEAQKVAAERNGRQIERARSEVARLRRDLADAEAHLARVEAILS